MHKNLDEYKNIYDHIRHKQYDAALNILFDITTSELRRQFKNDVNHSWYIVGDIFYKKQNYFDAIKFLKKSLVNRADDAQALWAIANSYSELKKPKLAERFYRKALKHVQKHDDLMGITYNLGNALFDQKRYDDAIACYEQIDKTVPVFYELAQSNIKLFVQNK